MALVSGIPGTKKPVSSHDRLTGAPAPTPGAPQAARPVMPQAAPQAPANPNAIGDAQLANMENRLGAAGNRRIGGRGAKPGATYRAGEFKGMSAGQAWAKMSGEPTPGGGPSKFSGLDAHAAMQKTSLAGDLGLTKPGQAPGSMSPTTRASAVGEFRNSPGVMDAGKQAQSRLFGAATGQTPVQASPGAPTAPQMDPVADFKRSLTGLTAQAVPPAGPATPVAPAATAKAPAAGAPPPKKKAVA